MDLLSPLPSLIMMLFSLAYIAIIIAILIFIYKWMKKILVLKQEHNDLLRELVKKLDNRSSER